MSATSFWNFFEGDGTALLRATLTNAASEQECAARIGRRSVPSASKSCRRSGRKEAMKI